MSEAVFNSVSSGQKALGVGALLLFLMSASFAQSEIVMPEDQMWELYISPQYQVSAEVPRVGFVAQPEANDYGRAYVSDGGNVVITVFATKWGDTSSSFAEYRREQLQKLQDVGAEITYSPGGNRWFVYSGYLGGDIFYFKATTRQNCPLAGHIYFKFPIAQKDAMSPIIERMEDSLQLNASDVCPL
ncbi:MAG: hypothetical protein L3J13_08140 [Devosiaceae bacterium]|nr:hypothetical protein [Devosiaceae bacterium]